MRSLLPSQRKLGESHTVIVLAGRFTELDLRAREETSIAGIKIKTNSLVLTVLHVLYRLAPCNC